MDFFDCNVCYGIDAGGGPMRPVHTVEALQQELARAGVSRAIVRRHEQVTGGVLSGNQLLADDLRGTDNLYGTWALVPAHTRELPELEEMLTAMKANRIVGWRLSPARQRFLPRAFALRDWLEPARERRIPIFLNTADGAELDQVADLMEAYPDLTLVLTFSSDWPSDRFLRPFVAEFPNLYLDLTYLITDGGIESFVGEYGAGRLLYGSGFPGSYFGANMLMLRHAQIREQERVAIASGNLDRIVREVQL
jgi:predicted TIM-barrel fold metal-dependent hydrolase